VIKNVGSPEKVSGSGLFALFPLSFSFALGLFRDRDAAQLVYCITHKLKYREMTFESPF